MRKVRVSTIRNSVLGRPDAGSTFLGSRRSEQEAGRAVTGVQNQARESWRKVTIRGGIYIDCSLDG